MNTKWVQVSLVILSSILASHQQADAKNKFSFQDSSHDTNQIQAQDSTQSPMLMARDWFGWERDKNT